MRSNTILTYNATLINLKKCSVKKTARCKKLYYLGMYESVLSCFRLCLTLCDPTNCSPPGSSVCGGSPGKNTGMGCHALLQRIVPSQGSNPGLPHSRQILYYMSHQGRVRHDLVTKQTNIIYLLNIYLRKYMYTYIYICVYMCIYTYAYIIFV